MKNICINNRYEKIWKASVELYCWSRGSRVQVYFYLISLNLSRWFLFKHFSVPPFWLNHIKIYLNEEIGQCSSKQHNSIKKIQVTQFAVVSSQCLIVPQWYIKFTDFRHFIISWIYINLYLLIWFGNFQIPLLISDPKASLSFRLRPWSSSF